MSPGARSLTLSAEEIDLLQRLDRIQQGARVVSTTFRATPIIQLLSSPRPSGLVITLTTNEWSKIGGALGAMQKIEACTVRDVITLWMIHNQFSSDSSAEFFRLLLDGAEAKCV